MESQKTGKLFLEKVGKNDVFVGKRPFRPKKCFKYFLIFFDLGGTSFTKTPNVRKVLKMRKVIRQQMNYCVHVLRDRLIMAMWLNKTAATVCAQILL